MLAVVFIPGTFGFELSFFSKTDLLWKKWCALTIPGAQVVRDRKEVGNPCFRCFWCGYSKYVINEPIQKFRLTWCTSNRL